MQTATEIRTAANRLYCAEFAAIQAERDPERALERSLRLGAAMDEAVRQARLAGREV